MNNIYQARLKEILTCPVCLGDYNKLQKQPYFICKNAHSVCHECYLNLAKQKYSMKICPICRESISRKARKNEDLTIVLSYKSYQLQKNQYLIKENQEQVKKTCENKKVLTFLQQLLKFLCSFIPSKGKFFYIVFVNYLLYAYNPNFYLSIKETVINHLSAILMVLVFVIITFQVTKRTILSIFNFIYLQSVTQKSQRYIRRQKILINMLLSFFWSLTYSCTVKVLDSFYVTTLCNFVIKAIHIILLIMVKIIMILTIITLLSIVIGSYIFLFFSIMKELGLEQTYQQLVKQFLTVSREIEMF